MPVQDYSLNFPKAGLDRSSAFGRQMPRQILPGLWGKSTPVSINVRVHDLGDRSRGGMRPGMFRHIQTPIVADWLVQGLNSITVSGSSSVQLNASGRTPYLVTVVQGYVYYAVAGATTWTLATNLTGDTPPLNFDGLVRSFPCNQLLFFVDGVQYRYFEPATTSVKTWVASSGQLPADGSNNYARLGVLWRGRAVLSGLMEDDQNVFLSKTSEPTTWNYTPYPVTKTDAVAFDNSPIGLVGDSVQTLMPYSDDVLLIGCSNSLYMCAGDPADGGEKDLISSNLGTAWGEPWCMGADGALFFVGSRGGVWAMQLSPGGGRPRPQRVSQGIEEILRTVDTGATGILMGYEPQDQVIHVFLSALAEPGTDDRHLTLDLRTMGWSELVFKNKNHNPLAICQFDGNTASERKLLLGSWTGHVRAFDREAVTDDGTPIESEVILGAALLTPQQDEVMLHSLQPILGTNSGEVAYEVLAAATAELALEAEPAVSDVWDATEEGQGGRGNESRIAVAAHALWIRLRSTVYWSMESVKAVIETLGPVRARGK